MEMTKSLEANIAVSKHVETAGRSHRGSILPGVNAIVQSE